MNKVTTFVGLDVHKKTISVAVAYEDGEAASWGKIPNRPEAIVHLVKQLGAQGTRYAYEAGPTGYVLCRQLRGLGAECLVAAPSKIEKAPGDRVKTDRRDALKLARLLRRGDLHAVWVPDAEHEAFRDLTRARQAAKQDQQRVRNRITKLLLRLGVDEPQGTTRWTAAYSRWLNELQLALPLQQAVLEELRRALEEAGARLERLERQLKAACKTHAQASLIRGLQTLRGVGPITAATAVAEMGDPGRFATARKLMGYTGYEITEHTSSERVRRGKITRAGNAHLRHTLGEAAWQYARPLRIGKVLKGKRQGQPAAVVAIAERADDRLHRRYWRLVHRGKATQQAATAVARELLGFMWAIARVLAGLPVPPPRGRTAA